MFKDLLNMMFKTHNFVQGYLFPLLCFTFVHLKTVPWINYWVILLAYLGQYEYHFSFSYHVFISFLVWLLVSHCRRLVVGDMQLGYLITFLNMGICFWHLNLWRIKVIETYFWRYQSSNTWNVISSSIEVGGQKDLGRSCRAFQQKSKQATFTHLC